MQSQIEVVVSVDLVSAAMKREDGFFVGMTERSIREIEVRYHKFLRLVLDHPHEEISPAKDIDEMWHLHMLHPVAYYNDCVAMFGEILDHDGGYGAGSADELADLHRIFANSSRLWADAYGEEYGATAAGTSTGPIARCIKKCAKCAVACRTACKKK